MTPFRIAPDEPWLAPLAGYSDRPFRLLAKRYGCAVACSEMVSVKGMAFDNEGTRRLIATCPEDTPMVLQLFGSDPALFGPVMDTLVAQGYRYFDLNAGCPVRKVLKSGSGVKLMEEPDTLVRIASIMVERAAALPQSQGIGGRVGVKFRLGFEKGADTYLELAQRLEDAGVNWVTLHPRYGRQMFAGQADWAKLALLKRTVSIPVIASGDLFTAEDGVRCVNQTGADAVMFARGALYDPSIFGRFRALMAGERPPDRDGAALAEIVREHIRLTREYEGDGRSFRKIRSIIPRYAKGLKGIRALRASLLQCSDWTALEEAASIIAGLEPADGVAPETHVDVICQ
ncbi:tRNA-dihydrouridine synthase family protein [Pseudodesulfovibrio sp. F-1]|uniref:tRNA-dihydrouridine synthase n=1 Tax=Pseudodesulfovibrio alkaliphilus TaxID=2661613 RepID=A0A7K1KJN3_9BACT|nr:tRNA-dihydrouridine synthase family protein [Pseudodesulfovibrio alkaliphilus]MUM76201.1 tRNA-dihydrouridine synthase family protein [Pseudodesulfovibrio alkaliphilus]